MKKVKVVTNTGPLEARTDVFKAVCDTGPIAVPILDHLGNSRVFLAKRKEQSVLKALSKAWSYNWGRERRKIFALTHKIRRSDQIAKLTCIQLSLVHQILFSLFLEGYITLYEVRLQIRGEDMKLLQIPLEPREVTIDVESLKECFALVQLHGLDDQLVDMVFQFLLTRHPDIRKFFLDERKTHLQRLKGKIKTTLASILLLLENGDLETLVKIVTDLGSKHKGYKVQNAWYPVVVACFLDAFAFVFEEIDLSLWWNKYYLSWRDVLTVLEMIMKMSPEPEHEKKA